MVRNASVVATCALLALTAFACSWSKLGTLHREAPKKLLLISIDTTRADHLSAYGYSLPTTPNLDLIAADGVRFASAYSVMPTTDPSHASMLTCEYPRTHGIMRNAARRKRPDDPSLGTWLQERGYLTAAITARIGLDPRLRRIRGFDHMDSPKLPVRYRKAETIIELVGDWLDARDDEPAVPWFLWAHLWEPHKPYNPKSPYRERFVAGDVPKAYHDPKRFLPRGKTLPKEMVEAGVSLYDGEIATADDAVAELVAMAREAEPAGEPLVMIVSDHGEALADRQEKSGIGFGHGALIYDEVVRVPWIVSWPGRLRPAVIDTPVSMVDLTPTLAGFVDRNGPPPWCKEGRSLTRNVESGSNPSHAKIIVDRRLYGSHPIPRLRHPETAWIEYPWKIIVNEGARRPQLYRLDDDPSETRDLARLQPERVAELAARLADWKKARPLKADKDPLTRDQEQELEALRSLGYID